MKVVSTLTLVVAVGCISGCATAPTQSVAVPLNPTVYNSGHVAHAIMTPISSRETALLLLVGGVPNNTAFPVNLYTYIYSGTCTSHEQKPAYSPNELITDLNPKRGVIRLRKSVPVPYETLRSGGYALVIKGSPADGGRDIFCGNLG